MRAGFLFLKITSLNSTMKHQTLQPFLLLIYGVIGWFLGGSAWRTCGQVCAASGMGATTQRKKLAYNGIGLYEGGELNHKTMLEAQMLNIPQNFIRSNKPPLLYSPCYVSVIFLNFFLGGLFYV